MIKYQSIEKSIMGIFSTKSDKVQHIIKSFNLTKTLFVSSIIIGNPNIGKKSLACYIFPNAKLVSGKNQQEVEDAIENYNEIIITDFEKLKNVNVLNFTNKRIIATASYMGNSKIIDELFAFIYNMPSLQERYEDVEYLKNIFIKEACSNLIIEEKTLKLDNISYDLSSNSKSLKKSIFFSIIKNSMEKQDIEELIYNFLLKKLDGNNGYREYLGLYERPLIKAGLKKFTSQLQLSQVLGINRNTLRKKIHEYNIN